MLSGMYDKFDPLIKVDVLQANPHYAHIRYPDGRETTVSTKYLAPYGHVEHVEAPTPTQVPTAETIAPGPLPQTTGTMLMKLLKQFKNGSLWY